MAKCLQIVNVRDETAPIAHGTGGYSLFSRLPTLSRPASPDEFRSRLPEHLLLGGHAEGLRLPHLDDFLAKLVGQLDLLGDFLLSFHDPDRVTLIMRWWYLCLHASKCSFRHFPGSYGCEQHEH